ncbi:MAG: glutamyl-tRNA amidotransferase [Sneathiella sp.]|nr:MAG: glutamyl-tRNA amidotransferase [Sneathiella sp.]
MRGLQLNENLLNVGAFFVKETKTAPEYRIWTINEIHPAMQRVLDNGAAIDLEVWDVPLSGLSSILLQEPAGLCIGKVTLADGEVVLGVLGEAALCDGKTEITVFGGWRAYMALK